MSMIRYVLIVTALWTALPGSAQNLAALNPAPTRVIGQDSLTISGVQPNLVEGRELNFPAGVALDLTATPAHLYVSDTGNNRVLGWNNASTFTNGQKADVVIGPPDFVTSSAQGPTTPRTTGLTSPTGLAVDAKGNLYVVDSGNNRILRFPQPFTQPPTSVQPDLVLGQNDFTTRVPNLIALSASTLSLASGGILTAFIVFDGNGNLWAADPGNNRVLRYPASALAAGTNGAAANLVLGQNDFVSNGTAGYTQTSLTQLATPTGLAFDTNGNLFVSESVTSSSQRSRVLIFSSPGTNGQAATRLLGEPTTLPTTAASGNVFGPGAGGLVVINNGLVVADSQFNRLLFFNPVAQFTSDTRTQAASYVLGQPNSTGFLTNQGNAEASASSFALPTALAFSGTELFVADSLNNRLLVLPLSASGLTFGAATRVLGQDAFNLSTVNLLEGREFDFTAQINGSPVADGGVVADLTSNPPHLYVADTFNNRVLGYNDLRKVGPGVKADIVIGQGDFQHGEINYPSNKVNQPNQSGLYAPIGVALDVNGNLYVADSGNGRVLRFPQPFAKPQNLPLADLVLGQATFTLSNTTPSSSTMAAPYGLAFATDHGLLVSDSAQNRVLYFEGSASSLKSGMSASIVFGQQNFSSTTGGNSSSKFNSPHHISTDIDDRLYVADSGNGRVVVFDRAPNAVSGTPASLVIPGLGSPEGVFVNHATGEIWVANTNGASELRYAPYDNLLLQTSIQPLVVLNESGAPSGVSINPVALTQDAYGDLYVLDNTNRVSIRYPGVALLNAANSLGPCVPGIPCGVDRPLAPGIIASLYSSTGTSGYFAATANATAVPLPTTLANIQLTVNGTPAPLFVVTPSQINFEVPQNAPTSGTALVEVTNVSTGQTLGSAFVPMAPLSPGLFTTNGTGSGQVAALNQDGTINGPSNPAAWGSIVSFYGTGLGIVTNPPADGTAATGAVPAVTVPRVAIGGIFADGAVQYAGLAPGLVGVWQLNVKIPNTVAPTTGSSPTYVFVIQNSIPSGGPAEGRGVTMWVKSN